MQHRSFNLSVAYLGVPNTGKTDAAVARCMELMDECYVLAHDGSLAIPETLHDGTQVPLIRYDSLKQCNERLAVDPRGIHSFSTVKLTDLMDFACRLACKSLGAQAVMQENASLPIPKNPTRLDCPPVLLFIDEAVMASEMRSNYFDPAFRELISQRRHKHVGIIWGTQSPGFVHHQALQLGSEVVLFRVNGMQAAQRLRDATIPEELIARCAQLPDHECISYMIGTRLPDKKDEELKDGEGKPPFDEETEEAPATPLQAPDNAPANGVPEESAK